MKINILNNTNIDITADCQKVTDFFKTRIPFPVEFTIQTVNVPVSIKPYKQMQGFNPVTGQPSLVNHYGLSSTLYPNQVFCWNIDSVTTPSGGTITSWTDNNLQVQLAINQYAKDQDQIWKRLSHEMLHYFCYKANQSGFNIVDEMDNTIVGGQVVPFYKNDTPDALDGNYAHTLKNLQPYFASLTTQSMYTYFNPKSDPLMVGVSPTLMQIADTARGIAEVPFKITSGLRTVAQNTQAGGVSNSAHLRGLALDIACTDMTRQAILKGFLTCGSPVFIEDAQKHIHVDISSDNHPLTMMIVSETD
jgi:hypothetical protein